jgi:hypothetical protein
MGPNFRHFSRALVAEDLGRLDPGVSVVENPDIGPADRAGPDFGFNVLVNGESKVNAQTKTHYDASTAFRIHKAAVLCNSSSDPVRSNSKFKT